MSDLERYGTCSDANGHWGIEDDGKVILSGLVSHDACDAVMDILDERDALKAEVKRLTKAIESSSYYFLSIKLQAEVERLTAEADWKTPARRNKALQAQVERLTKTGDVMAMTIYDMVNRKKPTYGSDLLDLAMQWKEVVRKGGQS